LEKTKEIQTQGKKEKKKTANRERKRKQKRQESLQEYDLLRTKWVLPT
jgi:hypothetical protein